MSRIDVRGVIVPNDDKELYEWFGYEATSPKDIRAALEVAGGETVRNFVEASAEEERLWRSAHFERGCKKFCVYRAMSFS